MMISALARTMICALIVASTKAPFPSKLFVSLSTSSTYALAGLANDKPRITMAMIG